MIPDTRPRQLRDVPMNCGNQPAHISMIHRRLRLASRVSHALPNSNALTPCCRLDRRGRETLCHLDTLGHISPQFSQGSRGITNYELCIAPLWTEIHSRSYGSKEEQARHAHNFVSTVIGLARKHRVIGTTLDKSVIRFHKTSRANPPCEKCGLAADGLAGAQVRNGSAD